MADRRPVTTLLIGLGGSGAWTLVHVKRQLYDAYDNRVPDNVALAALDTAKTLIVGIGAEDYIREPGMGIGRTELDRSEFAYIGGDSFDLVRDIDSTDNYPHIKSWFQSNVFLESLPREMFNIDKGAGQFRQFGRLALFRDVMTPATSSVVGIIDTKLKSLARHQRTDDTSINVIITGSLAGGTGAGLFIDVAHLVNRVAEINNIRITLRGFFFLPQAFRGTLNNAELTPAKGRAFGALRELKRFILNSDYEYGYPMYYHGPRAGVDLALWRASNKGKLYDYVYLIDGEGRTKMNSRKLEFGAAPAVADAIMAFVDEHYGPKHDQYSINTIGKIQTLQGQVGKKAFISTLGAYSIILPIQQIIEGWSYRLSKELILKIIPGAAYNERGYITDISTKDNPEASAQNPRDEVQRIATSMTPINDHLSTTRQRTLLPLPLWSKVYGIYASPDREQTLLKKLGEYDLRDWLAMLVPPSTQTDPDVMRVLQTTAKVLNEDISDYVETSDERDNGDPSTDHIDIRSKSDRYINSQLGQPASGGGRQGGAYRESLNQLTQLQITRFREYMAAYIHRELNGEARRDILTAKVGKLGWLMAVFTEFKDMLATVNQYLDRLNAGATSNQRRAEAEESLSSSARYLVDKKDVRGFNPLNRTREAVDAQKSYVDAVREYVGYYRMEFARSEISRTLTALIAFTDEIMAEFTLWRRILATDVESMHNKLLDGGNSVASDRGKAQNVANHRVINDTAWEERKYQTYVSAEVRENLFRAWEWRTDLTQDGSNLRFSLFAGLRLDPNKPAQEFRRDLNRNTSPWSKENLRIIMEATRANFRDAIQQESVLAYLMDEKNERVLAEELVQGSGYMLSFDVNAANGSMIPGNILLAYSDDSRPEQREYLREVLANVSSLRNLGDTRGQDNPTQIAEQCADKFRLTILSTAELLPMDGMIAYKDCETTYWQTPYDTRQKNHIFPAEVHSVEYEQGLSALEQPLRCLTDRVALLLEDDTRFVDFLFLVTHSLITMKTVDDRQIQYYWSLTAPSPDKLKSNRPEEWRLSARSTSRASLLEAAISYVIIGTDYENAARKIPYDHILKTLNAAQETDAAERLQRDELAVNDPELRTWLEAFMPPLVDGVEDLSNWTQSDDDQFIYVAKLVVRHDMMMELAEDFRNYVNDLGQEAKEALKNANDGAKHNAALLKQEEHDLFSISIIALEKEVLKYRALIEERYKVKTGGKRTRVSRG